MSSDSMRLQVFMAKCGVASRRKSEEIIAQGRVEVNGSTVTTPGIKVSGNDDVKVDGKAISVSGKIYAALNKPQDYLCSNEDQEGRPLAGDLLKRTIKERLFHVGRLDFKSSGLIFYTNDGDFTNIVTHPSFEIEKDYVVETYSPVNEDYLKMYLKGITIDDELFRLRRYKIISDRKVVLTLNEGKNREIRRFFAHFEMGVKLIHRIKIGNVSLGPLPPGEFRYLTEEEIQWFFRKKK